MPSSDRRWSPQQEDIFRWFADGKGNLVVRARAGTGKTTTILEGISRAPESKIVLAAFNKVIAQELTARLANPRASAKTLHSLGFSAVTARAGRLQVDDRRGRKLAARATGEDRPLSEAVTLIARIASAAKATLVNPTATDLVEVAVAFDHLPDRDLADEGWTLEHLCSCAHRALDLATQNDGSIDFDDMVWLPVRLGWLKRTYDLVVIDEAQDMSPVQLALAQGIVRKGGRIAVVGDDRQAIYGFRGADSGSIDRLKRELRATELGLTVTYRCPRLIVAEAHELVPDLEAAPSAPEGTVKQAKHGAMLAEAGPGDFVLSRKNAPLARICLTLLRAGKRAVIRGRDIGATLVTLVRKQEASNLQELAHKVNAWRDNAIGLLAAQDAPEAKRDFVADQAETILELCEGLSTIDELEARLEALFSNDSTAGAVTCSSVHKAKGLEAERVWLLTSTFRYSPIEEENITYVAITRSKNTLIWVDDEK